MHGMRSTAGRAVVGISCADVIAAIRRRSVAHGEGATGKHYPIHPLCMLKPPGGLDLVSSASSVLTR